MSSVLYLECTRCGAHISAERAQTTCPEDGGVLYARYDLEHLKHHFKPEALGGRAAMMWRYAEVLRGGGGGEGRRRAGGGARRGRNPSAWRGRRPWVMR